MVWLIFSATLLESTNADNLVFNFRNLTSTIHHSLTSQIKPNNPWVQVICKLWKMGFSCFCDSMPHDSDWISSTCLTNNSNAVSVDSIPIRYTNEIRCFMVYTLIIPASKINFMQKKKIEWNQCWILNQVYFSAGLFGLSKDQITSAKWIFAGDCRCNSTFWRLHCKALSWWSMTTPRTE